MIDVIEHNGEHVDEYEGYFKLELQSIQNDPTKSATTPEEKLLPRICQESSQSERGRYVMMVNEDNNQICKWNGSISQNYY